MSPESMGMFCSKETPHCDTLHTHLSFTADLKRREHGYRTTPDGSESGTSHSGEDLYSFHGTSSL